MGVHDSAASVVAVETPSAGAVMLPEGFNVAAADYGAAGTDLILTGPDGAQVVVRDYFSGDAQPALVTPEGARTGGDAAVRLAGAQVEADADCAGPAGHVNTVSGTVFVIRADGTREELAAGDPIYPGDVLESAGGGVLRFEGEGFSLNDISFQQNGDDTVITFGDDSNLSVTVNDMDADKLKGYATAETSGDAVIVEIE